MVVGFGDADVGGRGRSNVTTALDVIKMLRGLASQPGHDPILDALRNNLRNTRVPLRLPDTLPIAHKTGSLEGVAHDAGIVYGQRTDLAVAFLSEGQSDTARTSVAIGDCMALVWTGLGEHVDWEPTPP